MPLAFTAPGWPEILFILLIILVLFGAKRLPELAKGLGQSINEFRKAREELDREVKKTAVTLEAKEGLALINGTHLMAALHCSPYARRASTCWLRSHWA